jgi:hypothetical protein
MSTSLWFAALNVQATRLGVSARFGKASRILLPFPRPFGRTKGREKISRDLSLPKP